MEISPQQLADKLRRGEPVWLLDVSPYWEHELARLPDQALIPLPELPSRLDEVRPVRARRSSAIATTAYARWERPPSSRGRVREPVSLAAGSISGPRVIDPSVPQY